MRHLIILPFLFLAACGTPQERCIRDVTKDLRVLDRLIATSEANLERGYALEEQPYWDSDFQFCGYRWANGRNYAHYCWVDEVSTRTVQVAINLDEEAAKLKTMRAKRSELARAAGPAIEQCRVLHPEDAVQ